MEEVKIVSVWHDDKGWCVQITGDTVVFVYGTKRSALNALEKVLDESYTE